MSQLKMSQFRKTTAVLITAALLSGCAGMQFPVSEEAQASLPEGVNIIRMSTSNIGQYSETPMSASERVRAPNPPRDPSPYVYRVGPGDILQITTWATTDRTLSASGADVSDEVVVDATGQIYYPFVGSFSVRNKTTGQIRRELTEKMRLYISEPQVEVSVKEFQAHSAMLVGVGAGSGRIPITNIPKRLIDVLGGSSDGAGDRRQVEIRRGGNFYYVNLESFIEQARPGQNPIILPEDVIYLRPVADNKIFTFGEIGVGEIGLPSQTLSLTEVLANRGGLDKIRANARGVFVFRRRSDTPEGGFDVFQFDMREATALVLTTDFAMGPLDIVFVTSDPVTQWDDTVTKLVRPFYSFLRTRDIAEAVAAELGG